MSLAKAILPVKAPMSIDGYLIHDIDIYDDTIYFADICDKWLKPHFIGSFGELVTDLSKVLRIVYDGNTNYIIKLNRICFLTKSTYSPPIDVMVTFSSIERPQLLEWEQLEERLGSTPLCMWGGFNLVPYSPFVEVPYDPSTFNNFHGFIAKKLDCYDPEIVSPFTDLVRTLVDSNETWFRLIISWFSAIVKFPNKKTCKLLFLSGGPEIGKILLVRAIYWYVIGRYHSIAISSLSRLSRDIHDYIGNKILVVIQDLSDAEGEPTFSTLRGLTGATEQFVETEDSNIIRVSDFTNYVVTTDLPADPVVSDRRYIVPVLTSRSQAQAYYWDLSKDFEKPGFGDHLYTYLLGYNGIEFYP